MLKYFVYYQTLCVLTLMQVTNGGVLQEHVVLYVSESDCGPIVIF